MSVPVSADSNRLIAPQAVLQGDAESEPVLTSAQIDSWRNAGFTVVDGVFPAADIAALQAAARQRFPSPEQRKPREYVGFGSRGGFVFPDVEPAFNDVTLQPRLLAAVAQLLGVSVTDLRLTQSDLWPKYGASEGAGNQDQRIHVDYPNHMLAHPTPWERPEAIEAILYLSEFDECSGPTAVVPRSGADDPSYPWPILGSPGIGELDYVDDKASAERYMAEAQPHAVALRQRLYARERYVRYRPGTLLLYRHDVWHRGTPLVPGTLRLAQNLSFRRADCEWISTLHTGWAWSLYDAKKTLVRLIANASLEQRAVLGFPQPGNRYWCAQTIAAVRGRYGAFGMDMTPYETALGS